MRWEFKEPQEVWFGGALAGILISLCICSRPLFKWCQLSSFFIETSRASFFLILFGICPFVTLLASFSSLFSFTRRVYSSVASASVLSRIYEHCLTWNPLLGQHPQATIPAIPEVATRGRLCSGIQFLSGTLNEFKFSVKKEIKDTGFIFVTQNQDKSQLFLLNPSSF